MRVNCCSPRGGRVSSQGRATCSFSDCRDSSIPRPGTKHPRPRHASNLAAGGRKHPAAAAPWRLEADVISPLPGIAGSGSQSLTAQRACAPARRRRDASGEASAAIFAYRCVLWVVTITEKCLYIWEPYKLCLRPIPPVGRREAHQWGHELSASRHSTPCPLGRSETRAKERP